LAVEPIIHIVRAVLVNNAYEVLWIFTVRSLFMQHGIRVSQTERSADCQIVRRWNLGQGAVQHGSLCPAFGIVVSTVSQEAWGNKYSGKELVGSVT
jgi:hypothetical protein